LGGDEKDMIYLFYGTDKIKARALAQKMVSAARKKHAGAEFFKLIPDNFSENKLDELIGSQGLFYSGSVILADNLCEEKEISEVLLKKLKEIKASPNFFVFLEGELNKKELEAFKKQAEKVEEFIKPFKKLSKKEELALKGEKIDFFDFANALGERNKKQLWTLYQDALAEDVPSEEIHGIFFWQVKAMLLALKSKDATEAGLNPFVFSKAKKYAKNYGETAEGAENKLKQMSAKLFVMYHEAHRGKMDFPVALERFILEL
jgi:DNA polymerase III delta subunit